MYCSIIALRKGCQAWRQMLFAQDLGGLGSQTTRTSILAIHWLTAKSTRMAVWSCLGSKPGVLSRCGEHLKKDGDYGSCWGCSVGRIKSGGQRTSLEKVIRDWWQPLGSMSVSDTVVANIYISWRCLILIQLSKTSPVPNFVLHVATKRLRANSS